MRLLNVFLKQSALNVSAQMAYKANFFIRLIIVGLSNFMSPLLMLFIYENTIGVPGWSFPQFILLLGTFSIVIGLGHTFVDSMGWDVLEHIRRGSFDSVMVKPMSPLLYMSIKSFFFQTLSEVLVGVFLVGWAVFQLNIGFSSAWIAYLILVGLGFLFHYSVIVLICALAFLVVHSDGLFRIYWRLTDFARYPQTIYGPSLRFFLTFIFPISIASFYPAEALINGIAPLGLLIIAAPVLVFFCIAIILWGLAMKRYSSAGG